MDELSPEQVEVLVCEKNVNQPHANVTEQLVLLLISGLLVFLGQSLSGFLPEADRWQSYIVSVIGMLLFLLTALSFTRGQFPTRFRKVVQAISRWLHVSPTGFHMLWSAPILSLIAWFAARDSSIMLSAPIAMAAWTLAILFLLASHWSQIKRIKVENWTRFDTIALLVLTTASLILRGIALDKIPWVLTGDEGSAGLSAVEFINGTRNNIFGVGWYSFPSMFFAIQSASIRFFGQTTFALRLPSAVAGALTISASYFFMRLCFGRKNALMASAFLATFHFHIHFSRIGLNNIWDGLFMVLFSGLFLWAWKGQDDEADGSNGLFLLAGLILGASQYFYTSMRVAFGILGLWIIILSIRNWACVRNRLPGLVMFASGVLVVVLPLAAFYIKNPSQFAAPFQRVSIFGPWMQQEIARTGESMVSILWSQFKLAALAFTHIHLRHWYMPDQPMLLLIPSALFLLGIVLLWMRIKDFRYTWLALWILSTIAISALSESTPASQRLTLVAPAIALVMVLPLESLTTWFNDLLPSRKLFALFLPGAILSLAMVMDLRFYFGQYTREHKFSDNNTETANAIANFLLELDTVQKVYFCGPPRMGYYSHSTIPYLLPETHGYDVPEPLVDVPSEIITETTVYILLPERLGELELIVQAYPDGKRYEISGRDQIHLFTAYQIR